MVAGMKLVPVVVALLALQTPARADGDGYGDAPPAPPPAPSTDPASAPAPPGPTVTSEPVPPGQTPPKRADPDNPEFRVRPKRDIVVTVPGDRDARNIALVAGIAGAGAVFSAIGVYYHLDSKSAADEVSTKHPTNLPWTADDQAAVDRAHGSGIKAGVFYGIGGAVLIGAIVTYIVTEPKSETTVIHPHYAAVPVVAPAPGGAVLGGAWSF